MRPPEFQDPYNGREGVFQFTMDHLEKTRLFRTPEDYDYGVNTLAFATRKYPVKILCYSLMDNHFHLLVMGRYQDCLSLYQWIIHRLRILLKQRYSISGLLSDKALDVSAVNNERMLQNEVAYILRNTYKARIASPFSFAWNSADVYFNPLRENVRGTPFREMDVREKKALLQTHVPIPDDWEHTNGRILNRCFVAYKQVEEHFGDSVRFFDRLRVFDIESAIRAERGLPEGITFTDMELQEKVQAICVHEYHVNSYHQLDRKTLLLLARTLARRFSATKPQIGRLLGISQEVLNQLL